MKVCFSYISLPLSLSLSLYYLSHNSIVLFCQRKLWKRSHYLSYHFFPCINLFSNISIANLIQPTSSASSNFSNQWNIYIIYRQIIKECLDNRISRSRRLLNCFFWKNYTYSQLKSYCDAIKKWINMLLPIKELLFFYVCQIIPMNCSSFKIISSIFYIVELVTSFLRIPVRRSMI